MSRSLKKKTEILCSWERGFYYHRSDSKMVPIPKRSAFHPHDRPTFCCFYVWPEESRKDKTHQNNGLEAWAGTTELLYPPLTWKRQRSSGCYVAYLLVYVFLSPSYDCFMTSWVILDLLECITFSARVTYPIQVKKQKTLSINAELVCDSYRDFLTPHGNLLLRRLGHENVCRSTSRGLSVFRNLIFSLWMNTADTPLFFPALQRHPRRLWIPLTTYFACLAFHLICVVIAGRRSWAEISKHFLQSRELLQTALLRTIRPETVNARELTIQPDHLENN